MKHTKYLSPFLWLFILLFVIPFNVQAQKDLQKETEKNKRELDADFDAMQKRFNDFQKHSEQTFLQFRDSVDRAFIIFMRDSWKEFSVSLGNAAPLDPNKPSAQPNAPKSGNQIQSEEISSKVVPSEGGNFAPESDNFKPSIHPNDQKEKPEVQLKSIQMRFFGERLPMQYDPNIRFHLDVPYKETIPNAWETLAAADYYPLLVQFTKIANRLQLNDWGYVQLVRSFAEALYPNDYNKHALFTCFVLNKSGFLAKTGFNRSAVFLLVPSQQEVYNTPYLEVGSRKFYVLSLDPKRPYISSINSYEGQYRNNSHALDFTYSKDMVLPRNLQQRAISLTYKEEPLYFNINYNQNLIDFYGSMPPIGFNTTLSAPVSREAMASLTSGLTPILDGKTEKEKIDFLLYFVQHAFDYQTDQEQFGEEKYFFPEEVFHFPASDCEDRSALFAMLVRELVGLEVIGLVFPEHVATAVKFSEPFEGDFISHEEAKFLICDPTYIGATSGMCMPKYKNTNVQLVVLE